MLAASLVGATDTGTISGLVMDQDGAPVSEALVVVKGANKFATTNYDGYYVITPVPTGCFKVSASRVGYGEQTIEDVKVNAGLRTNATFELSRAPGLYYGSDISYIEIPPFWIQDLLLRYPDWSHDSHTFDKYSDELPRTPGIVYEGGEGSEAGSDSQPADEFAGALRRTTGTILGLVSDREGRPLSGVSIEVVGANLYAETDDLGCYSFKHVPPGTYDVWATYAWHGEKVKTRVGVIPGFDKVISFQF